MLSWIYKTLRVAVFLSIFSSSLLIMGQPHAIPPSNYPDSLLHLLCEKLEIQYPSPILINSYMLLDSGEFTDGCYTFRLASPHADFHFLIKYKNNYYAVVGNDTGIRLGSFCDFTQIIDIPDEVLCKYFTCLFSFCLESYRHSHAMSKEETDSDSCDEHYDEDIWRHIHLLSTDKYKKVTESIECSSSLQQIFKKLPFQLLCAGITTEEDFLSICRYLDEMIKKSYAR